MGHKKEEASDVSASEASSSDASSDSSASASDSSSKKEKKVKKGKKEKTHKKHKKESKDKKEKKSKDKKEKKSKKRGPRGAQWMHWKIPFQENSILGKSFEMAAKKGGVDIKKLTSFIKKQHGTPAFIIRLLKKEHNRGWKWEVDDSHNRLRVLSPKLDKKYKKSA